MSHTRSSKQRRSRGVIMWTIACCAVTQLATICLPGYPWPDRTTPEVAVRTSRFNHAGGWMRVNPSLEESVVQWQVHHLVTQSEPQDVIFIGGSSCLMGVLPRRIAELTQFRSWNLGTVATLSAQGHAQVLELHLKRHAASKPKLVVYHLAPMGLRRTREQIEELGVLNVFQEWLHGSDQGLAARVPLSSLPGFRLRRLLHAQIANLFENSDGVREVDLQRRLFMSDAEVRRTLIETHGYLPEPRRNQMPPQEPHPLGSMVSDYTLNGMRRIFEMTGDGGIELLFVMSPQPESYRSPENDAAFQRLAVELREAAREFTNVSVSSPFLRYFPDDQLGTPNHPTKAGAIRNSEEIAGFIKELMAKRKSEGFRSYPVKEPPPGRMARAER